MLERKILNFPSSEIEHFRVQDRSERRGVQLDMFAGDYANVPAITFMNLNIVSQKFLLTSIIRHCIDTIIDLRSRPVFPRPDFDHKFIMNYFYQRSVNYIECALSRSPSFEPLALGHRESRDELEQWISNDISKGVTACIVDEVTVASGAVTSFRQFIAKASGNLIEVHPSSL